MAPSNNVIDKFGRRRGSASGLVTRGPPGIGFKLTKDNNYDIQGRRLKNIGEPSDEQDAATRMYVDKHISGCVHDTQQAVEESAGIMVERVIKYVNATKTTLTAEYRTILDKKITWLTEQIHKHTEEKKIRPIKNTKVIYKTILIN